MEPQDLYSLSEMVLNAARFAAEKGAHIRARELYGIALDGARSVSDMTHSGTKEDNLLHERSGVLWREAVAGAAKLTKTG